MKKKRIALAMVPLAAAVLAGGVGPAHAANPIGAGTLSFSNPTVFNLDINNGDGTANSWEQVGVKSPVTNDTEYTDLILGQLKVTSSTQGSGSSLDGYNVGSTYSIAMVCNQLDQNVGVPSGSYSYDIYSSLDAPTNSSSDPTGSRTNVHNAEIAAILNDFLPLTNTNGSLDQSYMTALDASLNPTIVTDQQSEKEWGAAVQLATWELTYNSNLAPPTASSLTSVSSPLYVTDPAHHVGNDNTANVVSDAGRILDYEQNYTTRYPSGADGLWFVSSTVQDQLGAPIIGFSPHRLVPTPEPAFYQLGGLLALGGIGALKRRRNRQA